MNNLIQLSLSKLREKKILNPELDLKILLKHASYTKNEIFFNNFKVEDIDKNYFQSLLVKRLNYEPIAKIINKKSFWKSEFFVNSDVLDPRPESELIIEEVLNNIKNNNKKIKILDIGTGSGCLAISLAKEFKNSKITAIDISDKALKVAEKNVKLYNLQSQIELKLVEFDQIKNKFDLIVSNPPYIDKNQYENLHIEIKNFEPKIALFGGDDGLKFYKLFASKIEKLMNKNSYFVFEIGYNQSKSCQDIFSKTDLVLLKISKDIQKIDRTLTFLKI